MIKLINGYVVAIDNDYTLQIDTHKTDKKGKRIYKTIGYYSDLKGAIKGCIKEMNKTELAKSEYTLAQAVQIISDNSKRFEVILGNALKESGVVEQ